MLDSEVWGPAYWFVLHTIAKTYPEWPGETAKKKYYDLIQNLPLFLPAHGTDFEVVLDSYPVVPYLDSRESFCRWVHFVHNRVNERAGKPSLSRAEAEAKYTACYAPKEHVQEEELCRKRTVATWIVLAGMLVTAAAIGARGEILEL
tara:strand:- start:216 stop:656 length:441 start_codon:yes stop_codon:yes gene_type:complete